MKPIVTLIVDDEEPALKRAARLVSLDKDFVIYAKCTSSRNAAKILSAEGIDLLLLDIEMPELNGLDLLNELGDKKKPLVVFITAYDEYAVQAFEYYAIDYILKPFSNERFQRMMERVKIHLAAYPYPIPEISWAAVVDTIEQGTVPGRITVKTGKKYHFIDPSDINYIYANGNYCEIFLKTGLKYVHRETLSHIYSILSSRQFIRIHHSCIVSVSSIAEVKRSSFGELSLKTKDEKWLKVSRKYKETLKKILQK